MDINQIRAQTPELANLDDHQVVNVLHQVYYPDMSPEDIGKALGVKPAAPPPAERTALGTAGDVGISLLKGAIAVPEAAVGLADIPTGGAVGRFLENKDGVIGFRPKEAKAALDDMKSDAQKEADRKFEEAEGFGGKLAAAVQNPSVVGHAVAESLPSMAAGGVVGRGVAAVAPRLAGMAGGAVGEGVVGAGSAAEQIRQETADGRLTAAQAGLAAATGVGTSAFALLGGKVAKSLGIADVDTMLAGAMTSPAKAKGVARRMLEGAASEGLLEELPQSIGEQVLQNVALGKPIDQGVDAAAVLGLLSGAAMGGGANVLSGGHQQQPAANDPSDTAVPAANDPLALPAPTVTVGADGTAQTADQRQARRDAAGNIIEAGAFGEGRGSEPADLPAPLGLPAPAIAVGPDGDAQTVQQRQALRDAEAADRAARGGIVERGPLSRAANAALSSVVDVEARPVAPAAEANPQGVPLESASNQAPADEVGQQFPGSGGALLPDAATGVEESGLAGSVAPSLLVDQEPAVDADRPDGERGAPAPGVAAPSFASYEEADAYRKEQKARGATIQALPVRDGDGFALAMKGTPEYAQGEQLRDERRQAKERADAGVLDGDITNKKGMPFTIRLPANNAAKKAGPGHEVVPVKGGFVVRKATDGGGTTDLQRPAGAGAGTGSDDAVPGVDADVGRGRAPGRADPAGERTTAAPADAARLEPAGGAAAAVAEGAAPREQVEAAAHEAATSPHNDLPEPTDAQKKAGNYKLGHLSGDAVQGLRISVENPKGSTRRGKSPDGTEWENTMGAHYGYVKGSLAADGDHVDVFVGPAAERAPTVYVIDQVNADGTYDEAKAMFGFMNKAAAVRAYKASYSKGWKVGPITEMSVDEFKAGLESGRFKKPLDASLSAKPAPAVAPAVAQVTDTTPAAAAPAPAPAAKTKREKNADREMREAEEARAKYFTPGNVVRGYGGFDRVVAYHPPTEPGGRWSVDVMRVNKTGSMAFEDAPNEDVRRHSTQPSPENLKNGPAGKMPAPAADEIVAAPPAAEPPAPEPAAPSKITDAGEKIGGARKDRWKERGMDVEDLDSIAESEAAELVNKAAVWKPDWAKLVADGMNPAMAATAKVVLDRLAAKPKDNTPEGRRRYVRMMQAVRKVYGSLTPENVAGAKNRLLFDELKWTEGRGPDTRDLAARNAQGIDDLGTHMREQKALLFSVYKGRSDPFSFDSLDLRKVKDMLEEGFPEKGEPWKKRFSTRERSTLGMTPRGRELLVEQSAAAGTPLTMEQIQGEGQQGFYWEVRQNSNNKVVGYALNEAQADELGRAAYAKSLARAADGQKENPPDRPHLDKLERTALPDRLDRDATPQDFINDFGFRGVEFGNWAAQDERQRVINMAYDGLADLAEIMGVPKAAMSLNGTMGLAFGARGGGKFAAHYEPGRLVINMTKLRGGGSMAHEWAHAFDHYMGELDMPDAYKTSARGASGWYGQERYDGMPRKRMEKDAAGKWTNVERTRLENLRPELARAFDKVMSALFSKQVSKAEKVRDAELRVERSQARAASEEDPRIKSVYEEGVKAAQAELERLRGLPDDTTFEGGASAYLREGQKLNGDKTDGYWTRPTEMFARAFESWAFDRLRAMGAKSDYLVHSVEDGRYAGENYKGNPYPAGAERTAINTAFEQLTGTLKTRKSDTGGVQMFSAAEGMRTADMDGERVPTTDASAEHQTVAADLMERLRKSHGRIPPFKAVEPGKGMDPLKARTLAAVRTVAQRMFGHDVVFVRFDGPQLFNGVVSKAIPGKVFINIESAKPHMAILGHELLHHLQATNPGLYSNLHRRLAALVSTPTKFYDKLDASYAEQGLEVPENWDEEMIADIVGDNFMDPAFWQALAADKPTLFRRVANAIIKFLDDVKAILTGGRNPLGTDEFVDDLDAARAAVVDAMREFSAERVGAEGIATSFNDSAAMSVLPTFDQAVDDALDEKLGDGASVQIATAVPVLTALGAPNLPLATTAGRILKMHFDHGLTRSQIKAIGRAIAEPAAVFESATRPGSFVAVLDMASRGNPVIVAIHPDQSQGRMRVNLMASAYGKDNSVQLATWAKNGLLRYADKEKAHSLSSKVRVQFPYLVQPVRGPENSVLGPSNVVKKAPSDEAPPSMSIAALNDPREWRGKAEAVMGDLFKSPGVVGWWHKTVGTMHNLAQRSPKFKRVYDAVQSFLNDVSYYATEAADLAPRILPKLERLADLKKTALSAEDTKALSRPVFEGTLLWARDQDGRLIKHEALAEHYARMSIEDKGQMLLRKGKVTADQLKRWKGSALDVFNGEVNNRFDQEFLQAGVVFTDAELRKEFGLNDEQIGLYREFRKATDQSLNRLGISEMLRFAGKDAAGIKDMALDAGTSMDAAKVIADYLRAAADEEPVRGDLLRDTSNKVMEKAERIQSLIDHGYAPLSRYGQYTLDVVDGEGNRLYFGMFESRTERGAMARRMRANHPDAQMTQGTVSEQAYKLFNGITPETLELFGEMMGLETESDDPQSQVFQEYLKLAKANRSALKRLIHRKGIAGFSEDAGRVLAGFIYSNARLTSSNLHQGEITKATADIPKEDGQLKDMAVKLADYVRNPQEEAQAIRGLLFAHYIGGSIASALVNMTQPFAVTMPYLSQFGGVAKSATRMKAAVQDAIKDSTGDARLDAALKHAEAEGIVAPQEVHQLMAQARGSAALKTGDGTVVGNARALASNAASKMSLLWGKPFSLAEQFNRRVTFIAAYRTAVQEGIADPAKFAETAIADTQFVYNKGNKPQWARGAVGGIVFTFKQYSISYVELLHRLATAGEPGSPERAAGRKAALFALGMLFLVGGAGGLPFAEDAEDAIDAVMQRLGYSFSTKEARRAFFARIVGQGGAEFLERGISGLPGAPLDISGRLGMGDLLPGTGLLVKKPDHTRDVAEFAGAAGDLVQRAYKAAGLLTEGKPVQSITMMSPKASENLRKGLEMMIDGQYRDAEGRRVMDANVLEGLIKAAGFQPNAMARESDRAFAAQRMVGQNRMEKAEFQADMAQAMFDKDAKAQAAVREEVRKWNERNPESPVKIDMAGVRRRLKQMRMDRHQRLAKSAPKAIREDVRKQLQDEAK